MGEALKNDLLLIDNYRQVRAKTEYLCEGLSAEDMLAQSMPDASPLKWHLAHTTWFFETFILIPNSPHYRAFNPHFKHLFNSYYESVGSKHARPQRGLLTRPSLQEVMRYRAAVDEQLELLLTRPSQQISELVTVGLHHEMQHQELMLTDLLHLFWHNPMFPSVLDRDLHTPAKRTSVHFMVAQSESIVELGHKSPSDQNSSFSYDCENPKHKVLLGPHALGSRLITNGEWLDFMADGAYNNVQHWLSDGWNTKQKNDWQAPLYWLKKDGQWMQFSLSGLQEIDTSAPVCHISYYEADAYARWAGKRLPREHELELAAQNKELSGNFQEAERWSPEANSDSSGLCQIYGDVWEWTQSAFSPYPGFKPELGALGEYNGKFMSNQMVLKGGSCVTPQQQIRPSYRNFFYPHCRWQFSGLRLAEDL